MSAPTFWAKNVQVWRVRRRLARTAARAALGLCLVPVALSLLAGALSSAHLLDDKYASIAYVSWLFSWLFGMPIATLVSFFASARRLQPFTAVEVSDGDLQLGAPGNSAIVLRADLQGALIKPQERGDTEVELELRSGDSLCIHAGGREKTLARALGFDAALRRTVVTLGEARAPVVSVWLAATAGLLATCGGGITTSLVAPRLSSDAVVYGLGILFVVATTAFARILEPGRLVIGSDGVVLERSFRKRFFPRSTIEDVIFVGKTLALVVHEGDLLHQVNLTSESYARKDALFYSIREALALPTGEGSSPPAAILVRGNESIADWRERLRKLAVSGEGYRTGKIPTDTLLKTASDVAAPAAARLGAAAAIAYGTDNEAKNELRIATEGIANEKLRIAMMRAEEGMADEEAIAAALDDEAKTRRLTS